MNSEIGKQSITKIGIKELVKSKLEFSMSSFSQLLCKKQFLTVLFRYLLSRKNLSFISVLILLLGIYSPQFAQPKIINSNNETTLNASIKYPKQYEQKENCMNTALIIMDMKESIMKMFKDSEVVTQNVAKALATARNNNITIIYVKPEFRIGAPEINLNNKFFKRIKEGLDKNASPKEDGFLTAIKPNENDIKVIKRRISAFYATDLDLILRAKKIDHIVLAGVATSGVVLSTVRDAADRDYLITVLSDGCTDPKQETQDFLMEKIFPMQAEVLTVDEWSGQFR